MNTDSIQYYAVWSAESREWVGISPQFPSLSWPDERPSLALNGIKRSVEVGQV